MRNRVSQAVSSFEVTIKTNGRIQFTLFIWEGSCAFGLLWNGRLLGLVLNLSQCVFPLGSGCFLPGWFWSLEQHLVHKASSNSAKDWTNPVDL